jgi:transposase
MLAKDLFREVYMSYTKAERISIGEQIYKHELTKREAMVQYSIGKSTAELYLREYKEANGIPIIKSGSVRLPADVKLLQSKSSDSVEMNEYMAMSKEELIQELIIAKANELRAKKGYEVKGAGANKEFIPLNNKNSK